MKVLCIDNKNRADSFNEFNHLLKEGEVYTVLEAVPTRHKDGTGGLGYILEEIKIGNDCAHNSSRFIPLSEIDETELAEQRETVYAN